VLQTRTLVVLFTLLLGATAATANAATLAVPGCVPQNEIVPVAGTGFSPNAAVPITGAASPSTGTTDATGGFQTTFLTPATTSFTPKVGTLTATDPVNPAITASTPFQYVLFGSNLPLTGKPGASTLWRFAGFPGATIYGHYRFHGKTIRNYRFGKATGACGTLKANARRLPARSRPGTWILQIDGRQTYSSTTRPRVRTSFTITRRFF
jgi:hypothetical protein